MSAVGGLYGLSVGPHGGLVGGYSGGICCGVGAVAEGKIEFWVAYGGVKEDPRHDDCIVSPVWSLHTSATDWDYPEEDDCG